MSSRSIHIDYDPSGVSWLGQDPDLSPAERTATFEKIESGEWEIYSDLRDIREEGLRALAYGLIAGLTS